MNDRQPAPGISRTERLSEEGLQRLDRQLATGSQVSDAVLVQWLRRYGDAARDVIRRHNRYHEGLEPGDNPPGAG